MGRLFFVVAGFARKGESVWKGQAKSHPLSFLLLLRSVASVSKASLSRGINHGDGLLVHAMQFPVSDA